MFPQSIATMLCVVIVTQELHFSTHNFKIIFSVTMVFIVVWFVSIVSMSKKFLHSPFSCLCIQFHFFLSCLLHWCTTSSLLIFFPVLKECLSDSFTDVCTFPTVSLWCWTTMHTTTVCSTTHTNEIRFVISIKQIHFASTTSFSLFTAFQMTWTLMIFFCFQFLVPFVKIDTNSVSYPCHFEIL